MSKHGVFDPAGLPLAFYDDDVHGDAIPVEAVPLDDAAWQELIDHPGERVWNGAAVVERAGAAARQAAERRATLRAELQAAYQARLLQGIEITGKTVALDEASQQRLAATFALAQDAKAGGLDWPSSFAWRCADNTYLPLPTPDDAIELTRAAGAEAVRLRFRLFAKKDELAALPDDQLESLEPVLDGDNP